MVYNVVRYNTLQYQELKEHKWYMGEKIGYDPNMNQVFMDWVASGHAKRFEQTYHNHISEIEKACSDVCQGKCQGLDRCVLSNDRIHNLLQD